MRKTVLAAVLLGSMSLAAHAEITQKPATHAVLARKNLEHSLDRARRLAEAQPNDPAVAQGYVNLLLMRLQFYRDYADLDELAAQCKHWQNDARAAAQYLCADVDAARHDFVAALQRIALAAKRGGTCAANRRRISAIAATLQVDPGPAFTTAVPTGSPQASGSYESSVIDAAAATAKGSIPAAISHYKSAVASYRDVSPYPIAWAWYQVAELLKESQPQAAIEYYESALTYLPDYVAPRVELAALQLALKQPQQALDNLHYAQNLSADPDINALIAEALRALNPKADNLEQANAEQSKASSGFAALLRRHPYAFADHAAEVYSQTEPHKAVELEAMLAAQKLAVQAELSQLALIECQATVPVDVSYPSKPSDT